MKLFYCPICSSFVCMEYKKTWCRCRSAWGVWEQDGRHARFGMFAVPLGILNGTMEFPIEMIRDGYPDRIPFSMFVHEGYMRQARRAVIRSIRLLPGRDEGVVGTYLKHGWPEAGWRVIAKQELEDRA